MQRFKKPKENKEKSVTVSTHFIMKVVMPCVMLACKDEFKVKDPEKLARLAGRAQHNINLIANKAVSEKQLATLMEIKDTNEAMNYFENVVKDIGNTYE